MPLIYRAMLKDGDKPRVGSKKNMLGVRVPPDKPFDIPVGQTFGTFGDIASSFSKELAMSPKVKGTSNVPEGRRSSPKV